MSDRFEMIGTLGEGGQGVVLHCRDTVLQEDVAIKTLRRRDPKTKRRLPIWARNALRREFHVARAVRHPNLVPLYELMEEDGRLKLVMAHIKGEQLLAWGQQFAAAPDWASLERMLDGLASGLTRLHRAGLVHLDVKPDNVLVNGEQAVLLDFGISRRAATRSVLRQGPVSMGSRATVAPEVFEHSPPTRAMDWFAFGICAWVAATGQTPRDLTAAEPTLTAAELALLPDGLRERVARLVSVRPGQRGTWTEPPSPLHTTLYTEHLLGRDADLDAFHHHVAHRASMPPILLAHGTPGVGRTAVLEAWAAAAEDTGAFTIFETASVLARRRLDALRAIVDSLQSMPPEDGHAATASAHLADLQGLLSEEPAHDWMDWLHRTAEAFVAAMGQLSPHGVWIFLDDAHLADPTEALLLRYAAQHPSGCVHGVVLSMTDEGAASSPFQRRLVQTWRDAVAHHHIQPLCDDDMRGLFRRMAASQPQLASLDEAEALAHAAGRPVHLQRWCEMTLRTAAAIAHHPNHPYLLTLANTERPVPLMVLAKAFPKHRPLPTLTALLYDGKVEATSIAPDATVRMVDSSLRTALRAQAVPSDLWPRLLAAWEDPSTPDTPSRAEHLWLAGRTTEACAVLQMHAGALHHAAAWDEAQVAWARTREWRSREADFTPEQDMALRRREAEAALFAGKLKTAALLRAGGVAAERHDRLFAGRILFAAGDPDTALHALDPLIPATGIRLDEPLWRAGLRTLWLLLPELWGGRRRVDREAIATSETAWALARGLLMNRPDQGAMVAIRALHHARRHPNPAAWRRMRAVVATALMASVSAPLVHRWGHRLLDTIDATHPDDAVVRSTCDAGRAMGALTHNHWTAALTWASQALDWMEKVPEGTDLGWERAVMQVTRFRAIEELGQPLELHTTSAQCIRQAERRHDTYAAVAALNASGMALLMLGRVEAARAAAKEAIARWQAAGDAPSMSHVYGQRVLVLADLHEGQASRAYQTVCDLWPAWKAAGAFNNLLMRADLGALRCAAALQAGANDRQGTAVLGKTTRLAQLLGTCFADLQAGRPIAAATVAALRQAEMPARAWAAAATSHEDAVRTEAYNGLTALGIAQPERWASSMFPRPTPVT